MYVQCQISLGLGHDFYTVGKLNKLLSDGLKVTRMNCSENGK